MMICNPLIYIPVRRSHRKLFGKNTGVLVREKWKKKYDILIVHDRKVDEALEIALNKFYGDKSYTHLVVIAADLVCKSDHMKFLVEDMETHPLDLISGVTCFKGGDSLGAFIGSIRELQGINTNLTYFNKLKRKELFEVSALDWGSFLAIPKVALNEVDLMKYVKPTGMESITWCFDLTKKGYKLFIDGRIQMGHSDSDGKKVWYPSTKYRESVIKGKEYKEWQDVIEEKEKHTPENI